MPEGDSVFRTAAQLHAALAGQQLLSSDFRVPRFATLRLGGWTVTEVVPRGKHLLMRLQGPAAPAPDNQPRPADQPGQSPPQPPAAGRATPADQNRLTIHSHLKMEGTWQVYPPGGRWRKPGFTARCVLRTATADAVGFSLGILEVVRTSEEDSIVGHLGPDLLGPDWDPAEAERRIRASPDVPVGVALLDQRNLAGIGNIYRCEACFLSGIHPASPVSAVPDLAGLISDAKVLLEANVGAGRRTTVLNPRGVAVGRTSRLPGYWVYRREHQPCLNCGTPIRRGVLGPAGGTEERDTYFCPKCQPQPGPGSE
ncbi:endonuclease-8 [Arthrobacter sp. V4I6]|uniref:Fpg/Nei family DNA glycosylase n=1 Tax=unclassified Arthrobacter TaxID=235627 RepID=UPI002782856C|nr:MULTISPECIES: DNA-formamidopyrimidine glycosylase family protein [unclassified Arthrobacter]MDQ0822817.1 endonuclease-8 [Arthrobacter sp. V1I7]MDQ0852446.1 endonuclease-8 [Arthrobacter sp. V4I6]